MAYNEKGTMGAEVVTSYGLPRPTYASRANSSFDSFDSPITPPANSNSASKEEYDTPSVHPFSPFYSHPTTRTSFEQRKSESRVNIALYQNDIESGSRVGSRIESTDIPRSNKECTEWPGVSQKKSLCCQTKRRWNPMRNLSKRQKILLKVLIALLIIGVAVGLGIGIAKATGTGVWKNDNSETPIGDDE